MTENEVKIEPEVAEEEMDAPEVTSSPEPKKKKKKSKKKTVKTSAEKKIIAELQKEEQKPPVQKRNRIDINKKSDDPVVEFLERNKHRNYSHAQLVVLYAQERSKKSLLPSEFSAISGYTVTRDVGLLLRYIEKHF